MRALAAEGKGLVLLGKFFLACAANGTDPVFRQVFKGNVVVLGRIVFKAAYVTYVLHEFSPFASAVRAVFFQCFQGCGKLKLGFPEPVQVAVGTGSNFFCAGQEDCLRCIARLQEMGNGACVSNEIYPLN